MTPAERLEVWQDPGGMWRWAYVNGSPDDGEGMALPSTEPSVTREQAVADATLAYPGLPVTAPAEDSSPAPDERSPDLRSRRWPWLLVMAGLTGALAGIALRYRRWGVVVIAPVVAAGVVARLRRQTP